MTFSHERFNQIVEKTIAHIYELSMLKGGEYAGDEDRLANFRRNAGRMEIPMELVWHTYCAKHWDAIEQYIKDVMHGRVRPRAEPLEGRVDDMILYLLLFKAILEDSGNRWGDRK